MNQTTTTKQIQAKEAAENQGSSLEFETISSEPWDINHFGPETGEAVPIPDALESLLENVPRAVDHFKILSHAVGADIDRPEPTFRIGCEDGTILVEFSRVPRPHEVEALLKNLREAFQKWNDVMIAPIEHGGD